MDGLLQSQNTTTGLFGNTRFGRVTFSSKKSTHLPIDTSVKQGKFGAAMKTTYGVNSAVRSTFSAYEQHQTL